MNINNKTIKLHIGCGEKYLDGYVNIDYPQSKHSVIKVKADVYHDIRTLSYGENSVDEIRSHHLFEHFERAEVIALLMKWRRWLRIGGKIIIETPDFYNCALAYIVSLTQKRRMEIGRHMLGSQEAKWAIHYDFWDALKFKYVLKKCGFIKISTRSYKNSIAQYFPKIPFLNIVGNFFPRSFYKRKGGHKLPNIIITAKKDSKNINEEKIAEEILSQYLVGREGEEMLSVWMKQFKVAIGS